MIEARDLRVGVLGCGMISADHFRAWSACRGGRVVAVCDPSVERARARAAEFGIEAVYASPEAMLESVSLDVVDIITPRETHAGLVRLAARYGVDALCEKPLCPTYEEAVRLVDDVGDRIGVMVNENWRYRDYFRVVMQWLNEGRLGTVTQARIALWRASMLPRADDGRIHSLARQPFLAREKRVLIAESLIHEIDTARALFGEMDVVGCTTARSCGEIVGEDSATLLMRTSHGLPVTVDGVMTAAGHPVRAPDRLEIAGTRCSVILENAELRLVGAEQELLRFDEDGVRQRSFDASIQHFCDEVVGGGRRFWTSARDQLATLRIMEDAYRLAGRLAVLDSTARPPCAPPRITGWTR
jgi:predicted dehydrogenase